MRKIVWGLARACAVSVGMWGIPGVVHAQSSVSLCTEAAPMAEPRYPWEIIGENANELPNGLKSNVETNRGAVLRPTVTSPKPPLSPTKALRPKND